MKAVVLGCLLAGTATAAEPLDLNRATVQELAGLDGVDAPLAERIVTLRQERGAFGSVEELRVLPGIDAVSLGTLRRDTAVELLLTVGQDGVIGLPGASDRLVTAQEGIRPAATAATVRYQSADQVLALFAHEPTVADVQAWSSTYAKVEPEMVQRWLRASRAFAALPRVVAEYRNHSDWDNDFRYYDDQGLPPVIDDGALHAVKTQAATGQYQYIKVQATWYLSDLVMSTEQLRMIKESQNLVKLRDDVLGEATRIYYERRRLQVQMLLQPKPDLLGQVEDEIRVRELSAMLDGYTGGRFTEGVRMSVGSR